MTASVFHPSIRSVFLNAFTGWDKSHSKEVGGTGLGLSIVKHAVRQQNGKIELKSEVGKGTRITVRFYIDFTNA